MQRLTYGDIDFFSIRSGEIDNLKMWLHEAQYIGENKERCKAIRKALLNLIKRRAKYLNSWKYKWLQFINNL